MKNLKDSWVSYKREANSLKKFEKRVAKTQKLYAEYLEQANKVFVNPDKCDMHCGHTCVREKAGVSEVLSCMQKECACEFLVEIDQIVEMHKDVPITEP
jgi:hypothetical protein